MKKSRVLIFIVAVLILCSIPFAINKRNANSNSIEYTTLEYTQYFDTYISIKIAGALSDDLENEIESELELLHQTTTRYFNYQVNNIYDFNNGDKNLEIDKQLQEIILAAKQYDEEYDGYSLTITPASILWQEYRDNCNLNEVCDIPQKNQLEALREQIDLDYDVIDNKLVGDELSQLDLGSVTKGYAGDKISQIIQSYNINDYIIALGGNITVGTRSTDYKVGITDPFTTNSLALKINVNNDLNIVTSGSYERYYEFENIRYHHLIDPLTLMPSNYMASVTVIDTDGLKCDVFSTLLFNYPIKQALEIAEKEGLAVILIDNNGDKYFSSEAEIYEEV